MSEVRPGRSWPTKPVSEWPQADQDAWAKANAPWNELDDSVGYARRWRPATVKQVCRAFGDWLGWLDSVGVLETASSGVAAVDDVRVREYHRALIDAGMADYTISNALAHLADALRAMSVDGDWAWLRSRATKLHSRAKRRTDVREKMFPPEEVLQLGLDLMAQAESGDLSARRDRTTLYRDGLIIALQSYRALRISNLAEIELGESLRRAGQSWLLEFNDEAMKGKRAHKVSWPAALEDALERYLSHYRPILMEDTAQWRRETGRLWVSRGGANMLSTAVAERISRHTKERFGVAINPHTFRHVAATAMAESDPDSVTAIAGLLGHSDLRTSERYYNMARQVAAVGRYEAILVKAAKKAGREKQETF